MKKTKKSIKTKLLKLLLLVIVTFLDYGISYTIGTIVATNRINRLNEQIVETASEYTVAPPQKSLTIQ